MTSEQIKATRAPHLSDTSWLKEICLQLALLNEKLNEKQAVPEPLKQPKPAQPNAHRMQPR